jgi:mannose-1-phosphate guanylyltransferase
MNLKTTIILAGGLGTRLQPVLGDRPKVLALAGGKPFLHYLITYLASQRIEEVILSVGFLAEQVRAFAGNGSSWGIKVRYIQESSPLGTGGATRLACIGLQEPFLVINGDTLFLAELAALEQAHRQAGTHGTICLRLMTDIEARGQVVIDAAGLIHNFTEKPQIGGTSLANGGIYLFEPGILEKMPPGKPVSLEREFFPELARAGKLSGFIQDAYFCDIGTPDNLAGFENDLVSGKVIIP